MGMWPGARGQRIAGSRKTGMQIVLMGLWKDNVDKNYDNSKLSSVTPSQIWHAQVFSRRTECNDS